MRAFVIAMQFPEYVGYFTSLTKGSMPLWDRKVTAAKLFEYEELAKREFDAVFLTKPDYMATIREVFDGGPKVPELYIMEVSVDPLFLFTDDEIAKRVEMVTHEKASAERLEDTINAITSGFRQGDNRPQYQS
jgi:hypothetical protein